MKNIYFLLFVLIIITLSCYSNNYRIKNSEIVEPNLDNDFTYENLSDTIIGLKKNNEICFNIDLDQIHNSNQEILNFTDLTNNITLVKWHPFAGLINITKLNTDHYEFNPIISLPKDGNWNIPFEVVDLFKYILKFNDNGYKFYLEIKDREKYNLSVEFIKEMKLKMLKDSNCISTNWDKAIICFDRVKKYENLIFISIIEGDTMFVNEYLHLQEDFSIASAGEFAEFLEGNKQVLYHLRKLKATDIDYGVFRLNNTNSNNTAYCR